MRGLFALVISVFLGLGSMMAQAEAQIYGFVEKATLLDKNVVLSAKLDTGAKSASLNASNISEIEVNEEPYLRYTVSTKQGDFIFESKYIGRVKIKMRAGETNPGSLKHTAIKRPVVLLRIQLGDKIRMIPVNLTNRKRFIYPLLLGRDAIIQFNGAVNPALTFTLSSKSFNEKK